MKQIVFTFILLLANIAWSNAQENKSVPELFPVRALLLSTPDPQDVTMFCDFIKDALPKEGVNTLVMRINYKYQFEANPKLAGHNALSKKDLQRIVKACKDVGVRFIPKMNLLGHQSDELTILPLLKQYPEFDESPHLNPTAPWKPANNSYDFYSKSICPKHPDLFKVIFPLVDELIDVCGADAFHVALDEVWIIGDERCPRCGGLDKAEIFAEYVTSLRNHLKTKGCEMWMWSDRLIDGKTTGLLGWQASMNNTHRAIDMIPKDIMICDWKYEDAAATPAYFAIKGFNVLACPAYNPEVALAHLELVKLMRANGNRASFSTTISNRMQGMFETMWGNSRDFILAYYGKQEDKDGTVTTFKKLYAEIRKLKI